MNRRRLLYAVPDVVVHLAAAAVVVMMLVSAGQPIFTDDLWWHLAMGDRYAAFGPWLEGDPLLFAATGPAEAAAWLADVGLHGVHAVAGFQGLRVLHVLVVLAIVGLGWTMLRRTSGSAVYASWASAVFVAMSAYRLFQLRPHLLSILAALILVRLLVVDRRPPTAARIALSGAVLAVWANLHGAFVLGLVLVGAALGGAVFAVLVGTETRAGAVVRVRRLAVALGVGVAAACLNPAGPRFLLLYFTAGADTPDLGVVADEWAPVALFAAPLLSVPPTPLTLGIVWALLIATPVAVIAQWRDSRAPSDGTDETHRIDWALAAVAVASLVGMLLAVRLLWMGLFVLVGLGQAMAAWRMRPHSAWLPWLGRLAAAGSAIALVPGFAQLGDWRMISRGIHRSTYASPYSAEKYHAHGVWVLSDAGVEGRAFNDYWIGNFLGYWLAPEVRMFVNGSLNVPKPVMQAARHIRTRSSDAAGRGALELLDDYEVDVFVGTGLPVATPAGRPHPDTTRHVERAPGWIPVFRNVRTALYVRANERNRENLERLHAWYTAQDVPFDPETGFDPARVIEETPEWAIAHSLIPLDYERLRRAARSGPRESRQPAQDRLASIDLLLGVYDRSMARDRRLVAGGAGAILAARRLVWSLLHLGRVDEAVEVAVRLERLAPSDDRLSRLIVEAARRALASTPSERARILARLPVFTRPQGQRIVTGYVGPEPRPGRDRSTRRPENDRSS